MRSFSASSLVVSFCAFPETWIPRALFYEVIHRILTSRRAADIAKADKEDAIG